MKRSAALMLLVALAVGGAAGAATVHFVRAPVSDGGHFATTQRGHLARLDSGSADGRVVFLGSSSFQSLDVSAVTPYGLNLGIGGDTLHGLAERAAGYRSLTSARAVWINIGFNDLAQRCELPTNSLADVFAPIPPTVPVLVLGIQGVDAARLATRCGGRLPTLIAELNASFARTCASRSACTFVSHPVESAVTFAPAAPRLEADGIHLAPAGYADLIVAMRTALANAVPELAAREPGHDAR